MKKLLLSLASLGLVATSSMSLVACADKNNPGESSEEEKEKAAQDKIVAVLDKGPLVATKHPDPEFSKEEVLKLLNDALGKIDKVTLDDNEGSLTSIAVTESGIINGTISLHILYDGHEMKNPKDNNSTNFKFEFINEEYHQVGQMLDKLNSEVNVSLSNFTIPGFGLGIGALLDFILTSNMIPDKIPEKFDDTDSVWKSWQKSLESIKDFLSENFPGFPEEINKSITIPKSDAGGITDVKITIKAKILDAITGILPNLIHFRNYLVTNNMLNNVPLGLIQYLLSQPEDIGNDGFMKVDQDIKNINIPEQNIVFNTNLERLLHDLVEGWKNLNNGAPTTSWRLLHDLVEGWKNANDQKVINSKGEEYIPVEIKILDAVTIKYQANQFGIGIVGLLGIDVTGQSKENELTKFINQIFNYNLKSKLSLTLHINFLGIGDKTIDNIDLGSLITPSLKELVGMDKTLKGQVNNYNFEWTEGTLTIEIQKTKNGTWTKANKVEDLMGSVGLRVKFINNTWKVNATKISKEFTLKDKNSLAINLETKTTA